MSKLTFLGAGSAFTLRTDLYQSNMLITSDSGKHLLIDCGSDIRFPLNDLGLRAADLDAVYISHLHADHVGGMEWLAFSTFFNPTAKKPTLFANTHLIGPIWDSIGPGLESIEGHIMTLDGYFDVRPCMDNESFIWEGIEFRVVQVVHIMDGFKIVPSYGLLFVVGEVTYFITTDTQFNPNQINKFYSMADVVFQDCETTPFKSGVHAHYSELITLPEETRNKMWLYHYADAEKDDCTEKGFRGWVQKGQEFELGVYR